MIYFYALFIVCCAILGALLAHTWKVSQVQTKILDRVMWLTANGALQSELTSLHNMTVETWQAADFIRAAVAPPQPVVDEKGEPLTQAEAVDRMRRT